MVPNHCRVVIVGGGIVGCSTAYHLAGLGELDFVVLEQGQLTNGSTWHAAGLVGQLRNSANVTQLLKYSVELYDRLEQETGQNTGWKMNGGLRLACRPERVHEIKRQVSMAGAFGLEMDFIGPSEVKELCPILDVSDVIGAAFIPSDGQANPSDLSQALVKGTRNQGGQFIENCQVEKISQKNGRVSGVSTNLGDIECEIVVNCAGLWSRKLGQLAGVNVPIVGMKHHYIVTGKVPGVHSGLPTVRDPDRLIYFKEEVGGMVFGGYELNPKVWEVDEPPSNFSFTLLDFEVEHFEPLMQAGIARVPGLETAEIKQMICGPESFTPDGNFIIGESPELKNFYIGTGFNAFGIASAGGAGKVLAEWVMQGYPTIDMGTVDIRRFGKVHQSHQWNKARTGDLCGKHYTLSWPHEEHESGRPCFKSPIYEILKKQRACFGEKLGWERPNWFAAEGETPEDIYSFGRPGWFERVGEEHKAIRERVGIIDQSSFAKYVMEGPDALAALEWLCSNRINRPVGTVVYTQMLNEFGGIECDLTITRLADDRFFIVSGTGYATHHFVHICRNAPVAYPDFKLKDVTADFGTLSISGPRSRILLQEVTETDLSNDAFPFAQYRNLKIADADITALRVSFSGELGWELHTPVGKLAATYKTLCEAGKQLELAQVGYRALDSLRLEKGFRALGSDIGPDYTPLEAGMRKSVRLNDDSSYIGREALLRQRDGLLNRRLACFTTDDDSVTILGRETIFRNGERVGWVTSGGWGYTLSKNIAYGYVRNTDGVSDDYLYEGKYELEVEDSRVPVQIERQSLYDPQSVRMLA